MKMLATVVALALALAQPSLDLATDAPHHDHESASGLSLNDGNKWVADKHTAD